LRGRHGGPGAPARRRGAGGDPAAEALGRRQGGYSTKVHLRAEGGGKPLTVVLTPGQQHEATVFARLLEPGAVRRPGRGRPRVRPRRVVGDKGYTGRRHRAYCRRRGIRHTIPRRRTEHRTGPFDRAVYRLRHQVENLIAHCKQFRSLATRYEKRAESYRALWVIACTILWLRE
jgi:transposase